jgi:hypothetical protein
MTCVDTVATGVGNLGISYLIKMLQNNVLNKLQIIQMVLLHKATDMFIILTAINFLLVQLMEQELQIKRDNIVLINLVLQDIFYKFGVQICNIITKQQNYLIKVFRLTTVIQMKIINGNVLLTLICLFLMMQI